MLVPARSHATDEGGSPPSEAPAPRATFNLPPGEGATPADATWPDDGPDEPADPVEPGQRPFHPVALPPVVPSDGQADDPGQRESLLPLAQPLWTELTPPQQNALAPFAEEWNTWPASEKRSWITLADRLPAMPPDKQEKARQRIAEWAKLSPDERRIARTNYRLAKERPAETRAHEWLRYRSMTQEQRSVLREAGTTSNTAAGHAGAPSGLAREAAQPLPRLPKREFLKQFAAPPTSTD